MKNSTQMIGVKPSQFAPMIGFSWAKGLHVTGQPIAKLYCSTCQRVTNLKVGKYKSDMEKQARCPRCGSYGTDWMNSYPRNKVEGCVCIVDEEQV